MYGIVNKAIKGLVTENYGVEAWEKVKSASGVETDIFLSNEPYDDKITYQLAQGSAKVLGISVSEVLTAFGEYWILRTGKDEYGSLMEAGGDNLREFLINLPNFHSRVMLMFPDLVPPEFRVSNIKERELRVHYYSHRDGLQPFVKGLLSGLGIMYKTPVKVEMIGSRDSGEDHDTFSVIW